MKAVGHTKRWRFDPRGADAAARVRSELRRVLRLHERDDAIVRLDMIYAEIVSNAILHAPGPIEVSMECAESGGDVVLHVKDRGPGYRVNAQLPKDLFSECGRGLFIISTHSDRFEVDQRAGGGSHARIWLKRDPSIPSESWTNS
jgi:anti-sigma regulatory factor (Ser/Thr protein kinase)